MADFVERYDPVWTDSYLVEEPTERWKFLKKLFKTDYHSYRVLFQIEVLALLDDWQEPPVERLENLLRHSQMGGRIGVNFDDLMDLVQATWPLELAKIDVGMLRSVSNPETTKLYPLTLIKLSVTSLFQTWWAFETLMNDLAHIVLKERSAAISEDVRDMIEEVVPRLDAKGKLNRMVSFQPLEPRLLFLYEFLTGKAINKGTKRWQAISNLKKARDIQTHRLGKPDVSEGKIVGVETILDGLKAVRETIASIFLNTPEFNTKYSYRFLGFWSCGCDEPVFSDGESGGMVLGQVSYDLDAVLKAHSPAPSSLFPSGVS